MRWDRVGRVALALVLIGVTSWLRFGHYVALHDLPMEVFFTVFEGAVTVILGWLVALGAGELVVSMWRWLHEPRRS